jgi:hypothetical protein
VSAEEKDLHHKATRRTVLSVWAFNDRTDGILVKL